MFQMKLALLANRASIHTVRWANALAMRGHEVHLLSQHSGGDALHKEIRFHPLFVSSPFGYYANLIQLKYHLRYIKPDILHTHFASGYGTLGRLSGFRPHILSVWGSDIYDFPDGSWLHRHIIWANLRAADLVCSTSHAMARYTSHCCLENSKITVIPFGIDTNRFVPKQDNKKPEVITVGTVKTLSFKYGIDILIRSFAKVRNEDEELAQRLRLLIVGSGPDEIEFKALAKEHGVWELVTFIDRVPHSEVPNYLSKLDIYVAVSRKESFGVAVLEASACELPVVVSNVGGLPEVVIDNETGFIVQCEDVAATSEAIKRLAKSLELRRKMGRNGRKYVQEYYEWDHNVTEMESVYERIINEWHMDPKE